MIRELRRELTLPMVRALDALTEQNAIEVRHPTTEPFALVYVISRATSGGLQRAGYRFRVRLFRGHRFLALDFDVPQPKASP